MVDGTTGALMPTSGSPFTAGTGLTSVAVDPMGQFRCVVNRGITGAEELLRCSASGVPRTSFPKVPAGCQRLCRDGAASASRGESWPRSAAGPPSGVLEGSVGRMSWCFFLAGRKDTMNNKRHVCRSTLLFVLSAAALVLTASGAVSAQAVGPTVVDPNLAVRTVVSGLNQPAWPSSAPTTSWSSRRQPARFNA